MLGMDLESRDPLGRACAPAPMPMRTALLPCLAFLFLRGLLLLTNFDATCMPNYELAPMGQVAWSLANGGGPKAIGAYYDNCGGHLLLGIAAAPLFHLIGERYLALKLVTLACGLLTLIVTKRALARHVSEGASVVFAWAFALGTPALFQASCLAMGNHMEGLSVLALLLSVGWSACLSGSTRSALALGLTVGAGLFVYFGSAPLALGMLCVFAGTLISRSRAGEQVARPALAIGVGLGVGLLPLLWVQGASGGKASGFLAHVFGGDLLARMAAIFDGAAGQVVQRAQEASSSPGLWGLEGADLDHAFAWVSLLIWVAAAVMLRHRKDRILILPMLISLVVTLFLLGIVRLQQAPTGEPMQVVGRRYWLGLQYLTLVAGALVGLRVLQATRRPTDGWGSFLAALGSRAGRGLLGCAAITALCVGLSGLGWLRFDGGETGQAAKYSAVHAHYWAGGILSGAVEDADEVVRRLESLPLEDQPDALRGVGYLFAQFQLSVLPVEDFPDGLATFLRDWPKHWRFELARGVGMFLRTGASPRVEVSARVRAQLAQLQAKDRTLAGMVIAGLGREYGVPLVRLMETQFDRTRMFLEYIQPEFFAHFWRGHGEQCAYIRARGLAADEARYQFELAQVPPPNLGAFLGGGELDRGWGPGFEDRGAREASYRPVRRGSSRLEARK